MSWVPEELIRIKAHEIREKRQSKEGRDGILENDWNQASNHLKDHWWEVIFWRIRKHNLDVLFALVAISLLIIVGSLTKANWSGFFETQVTTTTTTTEKDNQGQIQKIPKTEQIRSGKTLWDWLELGAVPIFLLILGSQFQNREKKKTEEQNKLEKEKAERQAQLQREIVKNNLAEEAIQAYLDNMAKLLLDKELRSELFANDQSNSSDNDNPVKDVARTQTITILRRLEGDPDRQERIIAFLKDAKLFKFIFKKAHLSEIKLPKAYLSTNLQQAYLSRADLSEADLSRADLSRADLSGADLSRADLSGADLSGAYYTDDEETPNKVCLRLSMECPCPTNFPDNFDPKSNNMTLITSIDQLEKILEEYSK